MMLLNSLLLALRSIRRNLMRSFLTVLGIVIGVAAIIALIGVAESVLRARSAMHWPSQVASAQASDDGVSLSLARSRKGIVRGGSKGSAMSLRSLQVEANTTPSSKFRGGVLPAPQAETLQFAEVTSKRRFLGLPSRYSLAWLQRVSR